MIPKGRLLLTPALVRFHSIIKLPLRAVWRKGWLYQGTLIAALSFTRLCFLVWNHSFLETSPPLLSLLAKGMLFDLYVSSWLLLPMWLLLFTGKFRAAHWVWMTVSGLILAVEVIDIGYFPYTHRRSSVELLWMLGFLRDTLPALSKYVRDFLAGFMLWGAMVWTLARVGRRIYHYSSPSTLRWIGWSLSGLLLLVGLRGGIRYKPLAVIDASLAGCPVCTPFVLNTTFSILKGIEQPPLPPVPPAPLEGVYPRLWIPDSTRAFAPRYNVVVFILESFSQEYIAHGYAPFLRELLEKGASVKWGFAVNSRSAEGVPAILSGLPSWGEEPLIFTPYVSRVQYSFGDLLRGWGYYTAFFHGGNNGTMLLDSYARQAGFQAYFGRREFPEKKGDYDGTWGIWDEPFLQFCAQKLGTLPEPFAGVIFTLSSHHPYAVPSHLRDSLPAGRLPIHRAIAYADYALRRFFARVETTGWAQRTLFIFTADHTGPSEESYHPVRAFHVPIGFYIPGKRLPDLDSMASHIDILPSILEAIGYPDTVLVWGRSIWQIDSLRWAPQKPLPLLFQAVGKGRIVRLSAGDWRPYVERWEGSPFTGEPDTILPPWYEDFLAYLVGYRQWLEAPVQRSPSRGRMRTSSTTALGGSCTIAWTKSATASGGMKRSGG